METKPNVENYDDQDEWMEDCVSQRMEEGDDQDQAVAACMNIWREKVIDKQITYTCQCLECGHIFESEEHCADATCPECGGQARRAERPGPGKAGEREREYKTVPFELTKIDMEGRTIEGYAAVFGNIDLGGDVIHRGAFKKTLAERGNKIRFLWQHNPSEPLGRPLEMHEDDQGLFIQAVVSDTQRGRDALALLKDGAIDGLSIGYDPIPGGTDMSKNDDGDTVRNLREIRLWEASLVTFPMNEEASVTALKSDDDKPVEEDTKSADDLLHERKQALVESLRDALAEAEELVDTTNPAPDESGRDEDADRNGAEPSKTLTPEQEAERQELLEQIRDRMEADNG